MQGCTVVMPSPNSAFTWTGGKQWSERVFPSYSLRKRFLFGGERCDGSDVTAEVQELMQNRQSKFIERWKCRCDVIVRCCDESQIAAIKKPKIPKYDWSPIDKPLQNDNEVCESATNDCRRFVGLRPESPVPFYPSHIRCNSASDSSACESSHLSSTELPEGCLTPPASPDLRESPSICSPISLSYNNTEIPHGAQSKVDEILSSNEIVIKRETTHSLADIS